MSAPQPLPWLDLAQQDLDGASDLLVSPRDHRPLVAYHVQQAAEKAVKAALVLRGIDPRKSHDIALLAEGLGGGDPLYPICARLGAVSVYATLYRYPDGDRPEPPDPAELAAWIREISDPVAKLLGMAAGPPKGAP